MRFNPTTGKFELEDINDIYIGSGGYAANLYFTTIDSVVSGYKKMMYTSEVAETELTIPTTPVEVLARTYIYDGDINTTVIDAGRWVATFRAKVNKPHGATLRFEAFLRHVDNSETTLFSTSSDLITNTSYETLKKESTQPIFTCVATDRLGVRIYGSTTLPAGVTLNTIVGDGNASYFSTPLSIRHSQLRDPNEVADVQHLTASEVAKVNTDYLKLDQTIHQHVINGMPNFDGGLKVPAGAASYFIDLSPVVYNLTNYYLSGDAGVVFYFSPTADVQVVTDDGNPKLPILISGMTTTQPTIYMYLITAPALGDAHVTCFSDLNETDFLAFIKTLTEDPTTTIDYHETAFTYSAGVYTNVTTKPVCPPSIGTTWTNPSAITSDYIGFKVNPTTSNVDHIGNYNNEITTSIFKTKGQLKVGNGNLIDLVTCPITSNPILDLSGGGFLQFAMTFVPEIISTGTVGTPISRSVYASGVYGTTAFEGGYCTYSGVALGIWAAVQNAISAPTTLDDGVGIRAGITYSSDNDSEMYIKRMSCFQTGFTNLNNGKSKHDDIKHYDVPVIDSNKVTSCTNNYAFFTSDNSLRATNSWGLYSLEPANYAKKLFLGATPTKPTEDLEVQGNGKMAKCLTPEVKTDTTTPTDLTITTGAQKTLVLATPVYNDINTGINPRNTGVGRPTLATMVGGISEFQFAVNDYADMIPIELLHDWKEGTEIEIHCHWATGGLNDATVRGVKWEVECAWANQLEVGGTTVFASSGTQSNETSIAANEPALTHRYTSIYSFTPTGGKIGAQLSLKIKRIASVTNTAPVANPFLLSVGIHYQKDTVGSRQRGVK